MNLRKIIIDGITIEGTEQSVEAITKLQKQLADGVAIVDAKDGEIAGLRKQIADAAKTVEAKDGEIAALTKTHADAVKALEAKIADGETNIDARIEERQTVISDAAVVAGKAIDGKGKTLAAIRREAVVAVMGDEAMTGKSDEYVAASFDVLARTSTNKRDPLAAALKDGVTNRKATDGQPRSVADAAYAEMLAGLNADPHAEKAA